MAYHTYSSRGRKKPKKRRRGRRGGFRAISTFLTLIVIGAAITFALTVFFKITHIEVTGASRYTQSEIVQATGISVGDNLFGINKFKAIDMVFEKLPYVEKLRIRRVLPDTLLVEVTECKPVAYIQCEGKNWLVDKNGKLLEQADGEALSGKISLGGLTPLSPSAGDALVVPEVQRPLQKSLFEVLAALDGKGILSNASALSIAASYEVRLTYLNRFTVIIQMPCDLDVKTRFLMAAVEQLDPNDRGELDMTSDKTTRFIPEAAAPSPAVPTDVTAPSEQQKEGQQ